MADSLILVVTSRDRQLILSDCVLRRREKTVDTVSSGDEALLRIQRDRPGLVIFGRELTDMSAPEFCRVVRENVLTRSTSLLCISDSDEKGEAELCLAAGCNDVLFRPYLLQDLDGKIQKLTAVPIRKELRTLVKIQVAFEAEGRGLLGHSVNVSASGILVQTEHQFACDSLLRLQFYLQNDPLPILTDSQLVRAEFSGGSPKYGLRYVNLPLTEQQRLESFVRRLRSRDLV